MGSIARAFDYGRSTEGKLLRMLDDNSGAAHPLADVGWIRPALPHRPTSPGPEQDLLVAVYGMSFSHQIADRMRTQDPKLAVRMSGGPSAPLSQCVALFEADRGHHSAKVVILGVLASSLTGVLAMSHMTWNFDAPAATLFPRYAMLDGRLTRHDPPATNLAELRALVAKEDGWLRLRNELREHDVFFDPLQFDRALDGSILARLARRSLGQRNTTATNSRLHNASGFTNEDHMATIARALAKQFVERARADKTLPVLLLIENIGYADHLDRLFASLESDSDLVYFATHHLADPSDAKLFLADGHFTPDTNDRLAAALLARINSSLGRD
jgi:hypothetical protein